MKISVLLFFLFLAIPGQAQHWIFLEAKESTDYFGSNVAQHHIEALEKQGFTVAGSSRWLNAVAVLDREVNKALDLPFVTGTLPMASYRPSTHATQVDLPYGTSDWQIRQIGLDSLHRLGYTGSGVTIAVFDGGFYGVDTMAAFDALRNRNGILTHYDFARDSALSWKESTHGMQVLGLMAGYIPDSLVGASPDADFVLARTEVTGSERHQEEFNWVRAMEWADSRGVDIIHSSLGYSLFDSLEGDYTYNDMDGETTIITIAAELAASRGIFITNSAGNSGNDPWTYITAPCDGANVLCVGAVDSFEQIAAFSSLGPSSDGRVKPDLVAMGVRNTVLNGDGTLRRGSGTSFSAPLIAGAVACLMQAQPDRSNAAIRQALLQNCDRYYQPDSAYGYGLPDLVSAMEDLQGFTGVTDIRGIRARVFPNPSSGTLQLMAAPGSSFSLSDLQGKVVLKGTLPNLMNFLDIRSLASGTYLLRVEGDQQLMQERILLH